jgi:serine O-acetyltransferase
MFDNLISEIDSIRDRDPAARSRLEVIICYPSFHAMLFHRFASWFWRRKFRIVGRWFSQIARWLTGIEIHPGATIGKRFFIDHGMGVVIGEASEIGNDVTLYHGVTLGGVAPSVDSNSQRNAKRHPTLEDGVIVGSGAQILGPVVVGKDARVGANAVVTKDVEAKCTVVGIPAKVIRRDLDPAVESVFVAYGTPCDEWLDPQAKTAVSVQDQVQQLKARVCSLEAALTQQSQVVAEAKAEIMAVEENKALPKNV